jgi:hypothetical protein
VTCLDLGQRDVLVPSTALREKLHKLSVLDGALYLFTEILIVPYLETLPSAERREHEPSPICCLQNQARFLRLPQQAV